MKKEMKKQSRIIAASLLVTAFTFLPTHAETITVEVSGTVRFVDDYDNALNGAVQLGQSVSATYTYDASVPDQDTSPEFGHYPQDPAVFATEVAIGGITFQSNPQATSQGFTVVDVSNSSWDDFLHIGSHNNNQPLSNGAIVEHISFDFYDPSSTAHSSDAILTTAPVLSDYQDASIHIGGQSTNGGWYNVEVDIDSVSLVDGDETEAEGTFTLKAEVMDVYDPASILENSVQVGSLVDGSYRIDPNLPDSDPSAQWGIYEHPLGGDYGFSLQVGSLEFTSDSNKPVVAEVVNDYYGYDEFHLISQGQPLQTSSGSSQIDHIDMWLVGDDEGIWSSDALSADAPPVERFQYRDLYIGGSDGNGNYWSFMARVTKITGTSLEPSEQRIVSPASGFFYFGQQVQMALVLPQDKFFAYLSGSVNGDPIDESVTNCYPMGILQDGREVVTCAELNWLPPGKNNVNWIIHYQDGSSSTESVEWEILD